MIPRSARRMLTPVLALVAVLATAGAALAYAYTVVYGTNGPDNIDNSGQSGNFHVYAFSGSDMITGGNGNITRTSLGTPQINGYDEDFGDGKCTATPPGDDSYCSHPQPWKDQDWSDLSGQTDKITDGVGPAYMVGGGASNSLIGGRTYDVIVGGPHANQITGSTLGSVIIAHHPGAVSTITLNPSVRSSYQGLNGSPNWVDVYNGSTSTNRDTVRCASTANGDIVFADPADTITNCATVLRRAPVYPADVLNQTAYQASPGGASRDLNVLVRLLMGRKASTHRMHRPSKHNAARRGRSSSAKRASHHA